MLNTLAYSKRGLVERLEAGENILCAEGYLLALSRMGYIAHGVWVPEFLLEQPEVLKTIHYEFIHAGTDVTEAFQVLVFYAHVCSLILIGGCYCIVHISLVPRLL